MFGITTFEDFQNKNSKDYVMSRITGQDKDLQQKLYLACDGLLSTVVLEKEFINKSSGLAT